MSYTLFRVFVCLMPLFVCHGNIMRREHSPQPEMNSLNSQRQMRIETQTKRSLVPSLKIRSSSTNLLEVSASEVAVLDCEAGGNPPPLIHWMKDGRRIYQGINEGISQTEENIVPALGLSFTRSRLFLDCVSPTDSGVYSCVAENAFHRVSKNKILKVSGFQDDEQKVICMAKKSFGAPARINLWTHNRLEFIGNDVLLFCRVEGDPKPTISWNGPNELPVSLDPTKYEVLSTGDLLIRNIEWNDMGDYMCEAKNAQGTDSIHTFLYPTLPDKRRST